MTRISLLLWAGVTAVVGLVFPSDIARAAELKVLASVALTSAMNELSPMYEKATGDNLSIGYGLAADLKKRVLDGETAPETPWRKYLQLCRYVRISMIAGIGRWESHAQYPLGTGVSSIESSRPRAVFSVRCPATRVGIAQRERGRVVDVLR